MKQPSASAHDLRHSHRQPLPVGQITLSEAVTWIVYGKTRNRVQLGRIFRRYQRSQSQCTGDAGAKIKQRLHRGFEALRQHLVSGQVISYGILTQSYHWGDATCWANLIHEKIDHAHYMNIQKTAHLLTDSFEPIESEDEREDIFIKGGKFCAYVDITISCKDLITAFAFSRDAAPCEERPPEERPAVMKDDEGGGTERETVPAGEVAVTIAPPTPDRTAPLIRDDGQTLAQNTKPDGDTPADAEMRPIALKNSSDQIASTRSQRGPKPVKKSATKDAILRLLKDGRMTLDEVQGWKDTAGAAHFECSRETFRKGRELAVSEFVGVSNPTNSDKLRHERNCDAA